MREGESFAAALEARGVFPEVAVKMAEVGESTGALQDMLNTVADFYDEEIATNMERFVTLVEPVLLVVMGIVIAGLLLALYMPLFQLSSVLALSEAEPSASRHGTARLMADVHMAAPLTDRIAAELGADERRAELEQARRLAERYRLEFVDMDTFRIDQELFRSIPADLMLRYGFVPYRRDGQTLVDRRLRSDRSADDRRARRAARRRRSRSRSARGRRSSRSSRRARARSACSRRRPRASSCSC